MIHVHLIQTQWTLKPSTQNPVATVLDDGIDSHFEDAFSLCSQQESFPTGALYVENVRDEPNSDEYLLEPNDPETELNNLGERLTESPKLEVPTLSWDTNGFLKQMRPYTTFVQGRNVQVIPRGFDFEPGNTFVSIKQLLQMANNMKASAQFPIVQLYARVVYSTRENLQHKQYFQFSDLVVQGGLLSGSIQG